MTKEKSPKPAPSGRRRAPSRETPAKSSDRRPPRDGAGKPSSDRRPPRDGAGKPSDRRPPRDGAGKPSDRRPFRDGVGKPSSDRRSPRDGAGESSDDRPSRDGLDKPLAGRFFAGQRASSLHPARRQRPASELTSAAPERRRPFSVEAVSPKGTVIWGRRPIESYLSDVEAVKDSGSHSLHVIVDKAGQAPAQLRGIVELAKGFGIVLHTHKNVEDSWPLGEEPLNHQRVCLRVPRIPTSSIDDAVTIVRDGKQNQEMGCLGVVVDHIEDPGNFGAILRSCGFFNQGFVVFARDRQVPLTASVVRVSAGGAFATRLCEVTNIGRALDRLKEAGAWIVGASSGEAAHDLSSIPVDRPYVVVVGNESKGLSPEVLKRCDYLARIPGGSAVIDSLNVATATGILCYALRKQTQTE